MNLSTLNVLDFAPFDDPVSSRPLPAVRVVPTGPATPEAARRDLGSSRELPSFRPLLFIVAVSGLVMASIIGALL